MKLAKNLGQLSLIALITLLSACGGESSELNQYLPAGKRLTIVQQFNMSDSNRLQQTAEYQLNYTNDRLNRINVFDSSGTDNTWGTSDDNLYSYITCEFSGQLNQPLRDPAIEFYMPDPMQSSVNGKILMAILALRDYSQSLCSLGYQSDSSFIEKEFIPKINKDNQPLFIRTWNAQVISNKITGSKNKISMQIDDITLGDDLMECIDDKMVCDQLVFGFNNNQNNYQYINANYLADLKDKKLYEYIQQDGQLKTVNSYQYGTTAEDAMANVGALEKLGSRTYEYEKNQVNICTKNSEGVVENFSINTYEDKKIKQIDEYTSVNCAAEGAVQKRSIYHYQ